MKTLVNKQIGEYVAEDYRTAAVFSKYGIDFCCRGNRTINEVCTKKGIDQDILLHSLNEVLKNKSGESIDYRSWPLDLLIDYIEKKHHRYVEQNIPVLLQYLDKLRRVHGERHPELFDVYELFSGSAGDLAQHMKKEELVLFPFVKKMVKAQLTGEAIEAPHFGTVGNPIEMMKHEHDNEGVRFREIAKITDNYTPPADACNTYKVAFKMLDEFEKDLHLHIHLENNILFPAATKLEKLFAAEA
ncbi:iron-sulfur cluster repair di-iron protein [Zhouia amylolytica]|uniref:iron-sulfur cluster repair di-iron protein n=1 Tax=Zhouia amylolytica TaxID=376730 RepID=UPI0020CE2337|nr:iron-sulfur cluster repair di-iron protein [Zhouia amylolytica]MCQ0110081.1 iron-sulfur cluster repair di-iron protein [Zhouia amylolytica]